MSKPRIFLGSSAKQAKMLQALTRGLEDVADVEPWTASFNPGTTTLERLLELVHEVDFAAFVFARDDWTTHSAPASDPKESGQASPRDNVVFEAGLFGGVLGMRRTFILHASGAKLPSDLLGLTCIRYGETMTAAEMRVVNQSCGRRSRTRAASPASRACGGSSHYLVEVLCVDRSVRISNDIHEVVLGHSGSLL
jgi:predicted nucleotide-binding protein